MAALDEYVNKLKRVALDDIELKQFNQGYDPAINYIGPDAIPWLRWPRWAPYYKYLNRPAYRHDKRFDALDRTTHSNRRMLDDFALELLLDGVSPSSFRYWWALFFFGTCIYPLITIGGRFID